MANIPDNLIWREVTVRGIICYVADPITPSEPIQEKPAQNHPSVKDLITEHYSKPKKQRASDFVNRVLPLIESNYDVFKHTSAYCFIHPVHGQIDYYPQGRKLLIRNDNRWIECGLYWLFDNIKM